MVVWRRAEMGGLMVVVMFGGSSEEGFKWNVEDVGKCVQ